MIELKELSVNDGQDIYDMLQKIGPSENEFHNIVNGMTYGDFKNWLLMQHDWSLGINLPEGYVRQWTFWLMDNGLPVGYGKLREKVTDESRKFGGNIGFAIVPEYRGKGFGYTLFQLLIRTAKERHIEELFSTVEKYNYSSKRIHEKCGGILINEDDIRWYFIFE